MKETGTGHWLTPNADATNSSGFTALPVAHVTILAALSILVAMGTGGAPTEADSQAAHYRYLTYFYGAISGTTDYKSNGFSVRLVKD